MTNYMVWTSSNEGVFFKADKIIVDKNYVLFLSSGDGKVEKMFHLDDFIKNNPDWKLLENTE